MHRGSIVMVDFETAVSGEANKQRPAVIVSNDGANSLAERLSRGVITVVPITSNVSRIYPFQVLLSARATGLPKDSKAQSEQVRSVSMDRVGEILGEVPGSLMLEIDATLRLHLAL